jgi:hypothetical protein
LRDAVQLQGLARVQVGELVAQICCQAYFSLSDQVLELAAKMLVAGLFQGW